VTQVIDTACTSVMQGQTTITECYCCCRHSRV